jgi:hypothetical protein
MKAKIGKELKKSKTIKSNEFGWKKEHCNSKKSNLLHITSVYNQKSISKLKQLEKNVNKRANVEAERQRCSGILYANLTRIR